MCERPFPQPALQDTVVFDRPWGGRIHQPKNEIIREL